MVPVTMVTIITTEGIDVDTIRLAQQQALYYTAWY